MEITKVYDGNAQDFYDVLLAAFRADYQENTGQIVQPEGIKPGLKYKKYFGKDKKQSAIVEVEQMDRPSHYRVKLATNRGHNILEYLIETRSDNQLTVTYREAYTDTNFFNNMNTKLLYPFFKKRLLGRMEAQLDNLVRHSKIRKETI